MTTDAARRGANVAVVQRYLDAIGRFNLDALPPLLHDAAELVLPYPPPGIPDAVEGKQAFIAWMAAMPEMISALNFHDATIDTLAGDPDEVVAQYKSDAVNLANGKPYRNTYIARIRMHDGLIRRYAEWFNPLVFLEAFGAVEVPT